MTTHSYNLCHGVKAGGKREWVIIMYQPCSHGIGYFTYSYLSDGFLLRQFYPFNRRFFNVREFVQSDSVTKWHPVSHIQVYLKVSCSWVTKTTHLPISPMLNRRIRTKVHKTSHCPNSDIFACILSATTFPPSHSSWPDCVKKICAVSIVPP